MTGPINRRTFIRNSSIAASAITAATEEVVNEFEQDYLPTIGNEFFQITYDTTKNQVSVQRGKGLSFITGGTACVNFPNRKKYLSEDYKRRARKVSFSDRLGKGQKLIIFYTDAQKSLDAEWHISLYDTFAAMTFELICKNVSSKTLRLHSVEPIRVLHQEGGKTVVDGAVKCLTNGAMYYNAGQVHTFGTDFTMSSDLRQVKLANTSISPSAETVNSWWNLGLFSGYDKEGVSLGYLGNKTALGQVLVSKTGTNEISFLAESVYDPKVTLEPGQQISSDRFMINIADDPFLALEKYAEAVGILQNARTSSLVNGWCSWFYTLAQVSEDEVIRNAVFAAKHLKQFGLEYVQVDEGFQKWHGDWEGNDRFPHGMKWLAQQIKRLGFKPGIWISPYVISEPTELFQRHKDWLLKKRDGSLKRVGNWSDENSEAALNENPKRYCLDITHPDAANWLYELIKKIVHDWGYDMIKIDFVAWSILAADQFYDQTLSSAQVYRRGMQIMREAAGDKCHILECGPGAITVGLIDSMRIEVDINYGFAEAAWKTYFRDTAASGPAAAKRYYFHKKTWINDADHVCLQLLNNQQSEAAATLIGMSGGNLMSGDRLIQLEPYKLEILKKVFPSSGDAAIPVDLFDGDRPSVFRLPVTKPFASWQVVALFNESTSEPVKKSFSFDRLDLRKEKTYLAFDFWDHQFVGELSGTLDVSIAAGRVLLLSLHEKLGHPQFISTDRHILQGYLELQSVDWDEKLQTITGVSTGPLGSSHNVYVYIPESHEWTWGGHVLFHDYDSYSVRSVSKNIVQVNVRFEKKDSVEWRINCAEFFN